MLALAFLGMAASILVGLLASRVGAGVGRRLRENVFRKVVGFSNAEFDKFSTASLITRSTNDIQPRSNCCLLRSFGWFCMHRLWQSEESGKSFIRMSTSSWIIRTCGCCYYSYR
ncbi:MAG: hypothetical protein ACLR08_12490 [Dorea longicatena]